MTIEWLGHACFKVEKEGYEIIFDPYEDGSVPGIGNLREQADLVLCSHEHHDHNARTLVTLKPEQACPWTITEIATYHDEVMGAKRGPNTIYILSDGNVKIAHLGDLGCELEEEQLEQLKNLDAVMIPIGGFFTIDAIQAAELVKKIEPKTIYPMHYRDDAAGFGFDLIGTVEPFLEELPEKKDQILLPKPSYLGK